MHGVASSGASFDWSCTAALQKIADPPLTYGVLLFDARCTTVGVGGYFALHVPVVLTSYRDVCGDSEFCEINEYGFQGAYYAQVTRS